MGIVRAETIARMRGALKAGLSASRFIAEMSEAGLSYRRSDMLADWRSENELKAKEGLARFIRKGYYPTEKSMAAVTYYTSQEYMYKVKSQQRISPGEPIKETFVNVMSNVPMTRALIEQEAWERSFSQSPPKSGEERVFTFWTGIHGVQR